MANNMAHALTLMMDAGLLTQTCKYAIASRSNVKANEFKDKWGFSVAYGSYHELFADPDVDIIYIATTNNTHYDIIKQSLMHNKPVLCEKPLTLSGAEAKEVIELAKKNNLFLAEAMWTRYMPLTHHLQSILANHLIGEVLTFSANIQYDIIDNERIKSPSLGGGALLDLGVYCVDLALLILGTDIKDIKASFERSITDVDVRDCITLFYKNGTIANLFCSVLDDGANQAVIHGTLGSIIIDDINCPTTITIFRDDNKQQEIKRDTSYICGYEYELLECLDSLRCGRNEPESQTHQDIITKARVIDQIYTLYQTDINSSYYVKRENT